MQARMVCRARVFGLAPASIVSTRVLRVFWFEDGAGHPSSHSHLIITQQPGTSITLLPSLRTPNGETTNFLRQPKNTKQSALCSLSVAGLLYCYVSTLSTSAILRCKAVEVQGVAACE